MPEIITTLIASAGVGVAVAFLLKVLLKSGIEETVKINFSKHLESHKAHLSQEIEKLKLSLKKSETIFAQQLEALTKLRRVFRKLLPKKHHPDMDWDEACEEMANSFSAHADSIDEVICAYGAVLPKDVLTKLELAVSLATDGRFQFEWNSEKEDADATREAISTANELYECLKESVDLLQAAVDEQVSMQPDRA